VRGRHFSTSTPIADLTRASAYVCQGATAGGSFAEGWPRYASVESTIKQMNRRVKGTEKFWSGPGSESILQLRADFLSETVPLEEFWARRAEEATGERRQTDRHHRKTLAVESQTMS